MSHLTITPHLEDNKKKTIYFGTREKVDFSVYNSSDPFIAVQTFLSFLRDIYGEEVFGPRIQEYCYHAAILLMQTGHQDFYRYIPLVFVDHTFRDELLAKLKNPELSKRWQKTLLSFGTRELEEILPYLSSKFIMFDQLSLYKDLFSFRPEKNIENLFINSGSIFVDYFSIPFQHRLKVVNILLATVYQTACSFAVEQKEAMITLVDHSFFQESHWIKEFEFLSEKTCVCFELK